MTKDTGLLSLAAIARLHSGAIDAQQLFNQFALADRALNSDELMRAAKQLGFRAKRTKLNPQKLDQALLPAVVETQTGEFFTLLRMKNSYEFLAYIPQPAFGGGGSGIWVGTSLLARYLVQWCLPRVLTNSTSKLCQCA